MSRASDSPSIQPSAACSLFELGVRAEMKGALRACVHI